ncbi:SDR family NAD(P)-dependent oxidoreductase [Caulobacter vibrioides]|nr:SDR family NAD(P)-dependent oxidoreductase [Caulobacter vibrioides]YP_002517258.1 short chain dehydrogenase [Caulobacter vibrioides NA1000]ACL95350.1 short chain dehydrogenase [Caulobacter vibrioides NA1000]ATC28684.1 SDR family NAD(P)-dependent oxidoreductase [Caulobacter vibrioides]QXZ53864.1 SDR family oxidoreductase [Caulobacter vibrioides]
MREEGTMAGRLEGRVAAVTGASRGLGRATAALLAAEGAMVALLDLKAHWAQAAADEIIAAGGKAVGLGCDVSDREALTATLGAVNDAHGRFDVLVNNAMWNVYEPLAAIRPESLDRMVSVGFSGVIWGMQAAAPLMAASGGGSIVNIASVSAQLGIPNGIAYCGVKAGVAGMTRAAAAELGAMNIRVNAVAPSTVDTEGVRRVVSEERIAMRIGQTPLGRLGTTEDIAKAVRYLACDDSDFVTGQMLTVDGGLATALS